MNSSPSTGITHAIVHYLGGDWQALCGNVYLRRDGEISLTSAEVTCDDCKEMAKKSHKIVYPTFAYTTVSSPENNHSTYDEIQTFTYKMDSPTSDAHLGMKLSDLYAEGWTILSSKILPIFPPTNVPHVLFILSRPKR